uniref:DNA2/NAM7 helicase helicase domain-containing protein n=1 Tax=Eptatretus burgeri TaxID=7764 RepID=A0A8C4Q018_EPTBU
MRVGSVAKPYSRDFVLLYLPQEQYNESQSRAIVSAVTMIIPQPRVPKVFMLQGPPGTGKSRMIIGLCHSSYLMKLESEVKLVKHGVYFCLRDSLTMHLSHRSASTSLCKHINL